MMANLRTSRAEDAEVSDGHELAAASPVTMAGTLSTIHTLSSFTHKYIAGLLAPTSSSSPSSSSPSSFTHIVLRVEHRCRLEQRPHLRPRRRPRPRPFRRESHDALSPTFAVILSRAHRTLRAYSCATSTCSTDRLRHAHASRARRHRLV